MIFRDYEQRLSLVAQRTSIRKRFAIGALSIPALFVDFFPLIKFSVLLDRKPVAVSLQTDAPFTCIKSILMYPKVSIRCCAVSR
jgi:hypothetical protein